jgi:hypothetical protein
VAVGNGDHGARAGGGQRAPQLVERLDVAPVPGSGRGGQSAGHRHSGQPGGDSPSGEKRTAVHQVSRIRRIRRMG